ncbi:MAG: hypothetical protein KY442_10365 [Proteobacteria bacterium]|nr:hypothetical protein [Pseudomonadota bacterium]
MTSPLPFDDAHFAGGQPTLEELAQLAHDGVRTVIDLRASGETVDYDESAEAARLGMRYRSLPITGPGDLDRERVERFGRMLDEARREGGVLIHCASSNRAGALVALDEALNRGRPLDVALERGRAAGLAALEPAVVALVRREEATR